MSITTDVAIIGGGPGGYVCAIRLGQLGKKVVLIERARPGGTCLLWGCIPSKGLIHAADLFSKMKEAEALGITTGEVTVDFKKVQAWKGAVVEKLAAGIQGLLKAAKVETIKGEARLKGPREIEVKTAKGTETVAAQQIVIGTGGGPIPIPGFAFDGKRVISSKEALELDAVPKRMVLIGGGVIGLELGGVYAKLGTKVTVIEMMDQLLPGIDPDLVRVVGRRLKEAGVEVFLKAKAKAAVVGAKGVDVSFENDKGEAKTLEADVCLVAVGVRPATKDLGLEAAGVKADAKGFLPVNPTMQTNVPNIYAIGDVTGPPLLAHKASKQGIVAAEAIAGKKGAAYDVRAMPGAVFTDPEIATVGITAAEAKAKGIEVKTGMFPFIALGRAHTTGDVDGFVKIVADAKTDVVLGVHIVGPEASNLISEGALAIEMGATAEDLALTIHPHPTLPEGLMEAAEALHGKAIHAVNRS